MENRMDATAAEARLTEVLKERDLIEKRWEYANQARIEHASNLAAMTERAEKAEKERDAATTRAEAHEAGAAQADARYYALCDEVLRIVAVCGVAHLGEESPLARVRALGEWCDWAQAELAAAEKARDEALLVAEQLRSLHRAQLAALHAVIAELGRGLVARGQG